MLNSNTHEIILFAYKEPGVAPWAPNSNDAGKGKHKVV